MTRQLRYLLTVLLLLCGGMSIAQAPIMIPDSSIQAIRRLPRAQQDIAYISLGQYFYAYHDEANIERALLCYLEALSIAKETGHDSLVARLNFYIGSVYDALNIVPKAIRYYEQYYKALDRNTAQEHKWRAAYNLAIVYWKANDSLHSGQYLDIMRDLLAGIKDSGLRHYNQLLLSNAYFKIGRKSDFLLHFERLPDAYPFRDSDLAYGRIFAEAGSNYRQLKGFSHERIMEPLFAELSRTTDSGEILHLIVNKLGALGDYGDYHYYSKIYERVSQLNQARLNNNDFQLMLNIERTRQYNEQLLLRRENKTSRTTNKVLLLMAILLMTGLGITWYILERNKKSQQLLRLKNADIARQNDRIMLLIREIHHRVKNNLQIVNSLIELQLTKPSDPKDALRELQLRVQSIGLAHEMMYAQNKNSDILVLNEYLGRVIDTAMHILPPDTKNKINIRLDMDDRIVCGLDKIILLAIITNEMLTNSIKYAAPQRDQLLIRVGLQLVQRQTSCIFTFSDNGPGLEHNNDIQLQDTLGMRLIRNLTKQLHALLQVTSTPGAGLTYQITFPNIIQQADLTFKIR